MFAYYSTQPSTNWKSHQPVRRNGIIRDNCPIFSPKKQIVAPTATLLLFYPSDVSMRQQKQPSQVKLEEKRRGANKLLIGDDSTHAKKD